MSVLILLSVLKINVFKVSDSAGCDTDCEIFLTPKNRERKKPITFFY